MGDKAPKSMEDLQMVAISQLAKRGNLFSPKYNEKKLAEGIMEGYSRNLPHNIKADIVFQFARVIPKTT